MQELEFPSDSAICLRGREDSQERTITLILMAALAVIGLLFAAYSVRKVSRIVQPAYPLSIQCSLPQIPEQMPVYEPKLLSGEQSIGFGMAFGDTVGAVYDSISYSQDSSSFIDSNGDGGVHLLMVSNENGSYTYRANKPLGLDWADTERKQIEKSLARLNIRIPSNASFASEGNGWHSFRVEEYHTEDGILSGMLRCRYAGDGTVKNVENNLVHYSPAQYVETIPIDRILKVMEEGTYFQNRDPEAPGTVLITAAKLRYYPRESEVLEPYLVFSVIFEGREAVSEIPVPLCTENN